MTTYTFEFVNENDDIAIVEYNQETDDIDCYTSVAQNLQYIPPEDNEIYFCSVDRNNDKKDSLGNEVITFTKLAKLTFDESAEAVILEAFELKEIKEMFQHCINRCNKTLQ